MIKLAALSSIAIAAALSAAEASALNFQQSRFSENDNGW